MACIFMNSGSQLSKMKTISPFNFTCICHGLCLCLCLWPLVRFCLLITLIKCLKAFESKVISLKDMPLRVFSKCHCHGIFVRSCLLITLIKCLNGHKYRARIGKPSTEKVGLNKNLLWITQLMSKWSYVALIPGLAVPDKNQQVESAASRQSDIANTQ